MLLPIFTQHTHRRIQMSYFDLTTSLRSQRYAEMQTYFKNEYRSDAEWAFNNWIENRTETKKKVLSSISAIFGIFAFLRKNN